jgi:hypothetical protein
MVVAIVMTIALMVALGISKESYNYTADYERAEEPGNNLVAGTVFASPDHDTGLGWVL